MCKNVFKVHTSEAHVLYIYKNRYTIHLYILTILQKENIELLVAIELIC